MVMHAAHSKYREDSKEMLDGHENHCASGAVYDAARPGARSVPTPGGRAYPPGGAARMTRTRRAADPGGGCSRPGGWAARRAGGHPVGWATYARGPLSDPRFLQIRNS